MAKELLTDRAIRNATPRAKPYRLFDGKGLALLISPTGVKSWQLRYRLDGKDQTATLGKLDLLTLAEARGKAHEQRKLAESGEHLTTVKRAKKIEKARRAGEHVCRRRDRLDGARSAPAEVDARLCQGSQIEHSESPLRDSTRCRWRRSMPRSSRQCSARLRIGHR